MSSKKKKRAVEQDSLYPALEYINSMLELLQKNLPLFIYREMVSGVTERSLAASALVNGRCAEHFLDSVLLP